MKIAITGSDGLIGGLLKEQLKAMKHSIIECDRKNCDIMNPDSLKKAFRGAKAVVHCAAVLDEKNPQLYSVNVVGTKNVLEAAAENNVEQFIFISSVGVFGQQKGEKNENTHIKPATVYEKSKADAEDLVNNYQEVFYTTILRPAIVLADNKYWRAIIKTIGKNFPLPGKGDNKWQMADARDVVSAITHCIGNEDCYGETFIVAEKNAGTLEEIVQIIRENLGFKKEVLKIPFFLGMLIAKINTILKFSEILTPEYLTRMQADRFYSTAKIEATGWKAKYNTKEELGKLVRKIRMG